LERPPTRLPEAFAAKFFWRGESAALGGHRAGESARERRVPRALATKLRAMRCDENPRFIGTSATRANFHLCAHVAEKFRGTRFCENRAALAPRQRVAGLTHKIKRSHCYFFPAVVIGWQCMSIRDCTAPMSPSTQARRAAMAKKRKTKAAAKKTAKKTTRRKKKK
jgi:hypothetical protein